MAEPSVRLELVDSIDAAPALFGGDAFSTAAWYRTVERTALPAGARTCWWVARDGATPLAVLPMRRDASGLAALTTPYTVRWTPLLREDLTHRDIEEIGLACGRGWRHLPLARLDAIDAGDAWLPPFLAGLRRAGLVPLRFDHFGNWHTRVAGQGWEAYLAARPGALRATIARRGRRLTALGAVLTLTDGTDGLDEALAAYNAVYAASWKQPEPFPAFNCTLMRAAAADGSLRLGVLRLGGTPIAAQFWLLHHGWAGVQKLAHDEAHRALAPGTALTGLMVRHLLEHERVVELDFGRGDDAYKRDWAGERRQRIGVILAAPWRPRGLVHIARHVAGKLATRARRYQTNASSPVSTASQA